MQSLNLMLSNITQKNCFTIQHKNGLPYTKNKKYIYQRLVSISFSFSRHMYLSECQHSLLGANTASFYHHKVIIDFPIVWEATYWCDSFLCWIIVCGSIVLYHLAILCVDSLANSIDFLIDFCAMVVALLTCSGNSVLHTTGMPSSNTSHFTQTLVSLPWQFLAVPSGCYTWRK